MNRHAFFASLFATPLLARIKPAQKLPRYITVGEQSIFPIYGFDGGINPGISACMYEIMDDGRVVRIDMGWSSNGQLEPVRRHSPIIWQLS